MPLSIPVKAIAFNSFSVVLDEIQYIFKLIWNSREESWRLDIFDGSETRLVSGLKLVPARLLNLEYKDPRLPKGFIGIDSRTPNTRPDFDSLGSSIKLIYFTEQEVKDGIV